MAYLLAALVTLILTSYAHADTWPVTCNRTAASASLSAVNAAITAAKAGDTICIPSGTATWTAGAQINIFGNAGKYVNLVGAGVPGTRGAATTGGTTIRVDQAQCCGGSSVLYIGETLATYISILNITFEMGTSGDAVPDYIITIAPIRNNPLVRGNTVRIGYVTFNWHTHDPRNTIAISSGGGLIDHSKFVFEYNPNGVHDNPIFGVRCTLNDGGNPTDAHTAWKSNSVYGDADTGLTRQVYVEDNEFVLDSYAVEIDNGCRMVVRNNIFRSSTQTSHGYDTSPVGARHYEVYDNTFTCETTNNNIRNFHSLRGGTAIIAGNTYPNANANCGGNVSTASVGRTWSPGICWNHTWGYPITRQAGWGYHTAPHDVSATKENGTGLDSRGQTTEQDLEPTYFFANTNVSGFGGELGYNLSTPCDGQTTRDYFVTNREYFSDTLGASCSGATCTQGVGVGTLASRPASCTHNVGGITGAGVGYYATDNQTFYKCTAANTWTKYWKRATYPHFLATVLGSSSSGGGGTVAPPGRRH